VSAPHSSVAVRDRQRRDQARAPGHRGISGRGSQARSACGKAAAYAAKGPGGCARGATVRNRGDRLVRAAKTAPTRRSNTSKESTRTGDHPV